MSTQSAKTLASPRSHPSSADQLLMPLRMRARTAAGAFDGPRRYDELRSVGTPMSDTREYIDAQRNLRLLVRDEASTRFQNCRSPITFTACPRAVSRRISISL